MSGQSDNDFVIKGLTHGAVDYMLKPLQLDELKYIWQHAVRSRHLAAAAAAAKSSASVKLSGSEEREGSEAPAGTSQPPATRDSERPQRKAESRKRKESAEDIQRDEDNEASQLCPVPARRIKFRTLPPAIVRTLTHSQSFWPRPSTLQAEEDASAAGAKKPRVVWSSELHQQFVDAVDSLGVDKAVPKRILDLMSVDVRSAGTLCRSAPLPACRLPLKRS